MNNHSMHTADYATHLKIVALAFVAAIVFTGIGVSARSGDGYTQQARVIKAGKPAAIASTDALVIR